MLRLAAPWMLALVVPALLAGWGMARRRTRADARLALPRAALLARISSPWARLDAALPWLRGAALVLLAGALARPQSGQRIETVSSFGVDIVIALDQSGSMRAEDFRPNNRLEVAKRMVDEFVEGRPNDRIGLVAFGSLATTRCPLTLDHDMLRSFLEEISFAPRDEGGTALGLGLATAVNRLRTSGARSRVVVLVTDGRNNAGEIAPAAAAEAARALGVRVHTVGVGGEGEARIRVDSGPFGPRYVFQRLDLDERQLREIARIAGGRYFRASDSEGLRRVFSSIDAMEKTEVESKVRMLYTEWFTVLLWPAAALFAAERALSVTRLRRLP